MFLGQKVVGADIKGKFVIPSYQRGYRWGRWEVKRLLDDIRQNGNATYCLQPIVVKVLDKETYELIDGQQRLTTLYILLTFLKREYKPKITIPFEIEYEIRKGSADYLKNITEERASEYIDYHYMYQAFVTIGEWFSKQKNDVVAADKMYEFLATNVEVIWYEVDEDVSGIDLFERLNIGKIPLTDAELVKALFLTERATKLDDAGSKLDDTKKNEIAYLWDSIEKELHSDDFWYFIAPEGKQYSTRIDLVLELATKGKYANDNYGIFFEFQEMMDDDGSLVSVWEKIESTFLILKDWFENDEYYHRIGYLIAIGKSLKDIFLLSVGKSKSAFIGKLDEMIRKSVDIGDREYLDLSYENKKTDYGKIKSILFLFNVLSTMRADGGSQRFSFKTFRKSKMSLEHIHAQQSEGLSTEKEWREWLTEHEKILKVLPESITPSLIDDIDKVLAKASITKTDFEAIYPKVIEILSPSGETESLHDISNLALLDFADNAALNNSVFSVKRAKVIELDKEGLYIQKKKKNVFQKYYSSDNNDPLQFYYWGKRDRKAYIAAINTVLAGYLKKEI